jgi:hypothetical protein
MATNNLINHYDRRGLGEIAEELKTPTTFLVDTFWNDADEFATKDVDYDIYSGKRRTAPAGYRNEEGAHVNKLGFTTRTFTPLTYKPKKTITPDDILKRAPGGVIYDNSGNLAPQIQNFVAREINDLDEMITRSEEFQAKQALFDGSITYYDKDRNSVGPAISMQRNANLSYTLTTEWDDSGTDPLADLREARRRINLYSGFMAQTVLLGYEAMDKFMNVAAVYNSLSKDWSKRGELAYDMRDNGGIWLGMVDGFDIWTYEGYIINPSSGTEELIIPSKKVLVTSLNARQTKLYGAVAIEDNDGNLIIEATARYVDMYSAGKDPAGTMIQVHSAPLMARQHPNADAILTVLT